MSTAHSDDLLEPLAGLRPDGGHPTTDTTATQRNPDNRADLDVHSFRDRVREAVVNGEGREVGNDLSNGLQRSAADL